MTFAEKLSRISLDLQTIVARMNADESFEIASAAQSAVIAVASVKRIGGEWFDDLPWAWTPPKPEHKA